MNLLADEGVDCQIVDRLRALGHEVFCAAESPPTTSDDALLDRQGVRSLLKTPAELTCGRPSWNDAGRKVGFCRNRPY